MLCYLHCYALTQVSFKKGWIRNWISLYLYFFLNVKNIYKGVQLKKKRKKEAIYSKIKCINCAQSDSVLLCWCRDSGQRDVFFTLSYQSDDGPTSVRVQLNNLLFSLYGSHRTFSSLFTLLTYYTGSSCKLTVPYRKRRPERLKQMCRRALVRTYGAESISTLPGLSVQVKDYVHAYPYFI